MVIFTVESAIARGLIGFDVNDNNTVSNATPTINVVDDGLSSEELANKISGGIFYLHGNTQGQYADSAMVTQNFRNYLVDDVTLYNPVFTAADANDITLPHIKLQSDNPNIQANVIKDGQQLTPSITLDAHNYPEIFNAIRKWWLFWSSCQPNSSSN